MKFSTTTGSVPANENQKSFKSIMRVSFMSLFLNSLLLLSYGQRGPSISMRIERVPFNPAANLDQSRNGSAASPTSPVDWVNGNAGASNSHYVEGMSIPYRAILTDLPTSTPITITFGYDIKHSSKHAIDYLTYYDRLQPHGPFGHTQEVINPIQGLSGSFTGPNTKPIPAPNSINSPVAGQPTASFSALPDGERVMSIWNGTISAISYVLMKAKVICLQQTQKRKSV